MSDPRNKRQVIPLPTGDIREEISDADERNFLRTVSTHLDQDQVERIIHPRKRYPHQKQVLAVHWHPEYIPLELVTRRLHHLYPQRVDELVIPTQHNILLTYNGFSGVEVDCYSEGFNQKVQLLLHFSAEKLHRADVLRAMLEYTFKYRSSQLYDLIHTFTKPNEQRLDAAVADTGADADVVRFVRIAVGKVERLIEQHAGRIPTEMLKNKLLRDFIDTLRPTAGSPFISRAQAYLKAVKKIVKAQFPLTYFYRTNEIIEEARSIGAGIVIPHPEQFWPILLADIDVDGIEVWNPQSRRYTEFLISVLYQKNTARQTRRRLLVFMGDDTHMSEKVKEPAFQDPSKAAREIGVQQAWDDLRIRKRLIVARMDREQVMQEYRERLRG